MKRILLLLLMLNAFSIAFSQSQNNKETIEDFEIESLMLMDLEAVVLTSLKSGRTGCGMSCTTSIVTVVTQCGFICSVNGVTVENSTEKDTVKLFPNPSSNGFFNLNLKEKYNDVQITISSITGQKIHSKVFQNVNNKMSLNLSQYPSGIYLINIIADGKRLPTKKAIRG